MRIAVLIYGRLNKCALHHQNIMESLGSDNDIDFFCSSDNSSESLLSDFVSLYKPILYNNNPINYMNELHDYCNKLNINYSLWRENLNCHNMYCHFTNKNRVLILLEEHINRNNVQYDCVVSLRIDVIFKNNFVFSSLEDNTIYIPIGSDWEGGINDQIAYGNIDVMKKYNSINFVDLLKKKLCVIHPETANMANIKYYNLKIQRIDLSYHLDK